MGKLHQCLVNELASKHKLISNKIEEWSDGSQSVVLERDESHDRYCQATVRVTTETEVTCHVGLYRERAIVNDGESNEESLELAVANAVARFNLIVSSLEDRNVQIECHRG
jgi:hypothetical protein